MKKRFVGMKARGISVVIGAAVIVLAVVGLSTQPGAPPPPIEDSTQISDQSTEFEINTAVTSPTISKKYEPLTITALLQILIFLIALSLILKSLRLVETLVVSHSAIFSEKFGGSRNLPVVY